MAGSSGYKLDQPTVDAIIELISTYISTGQLPGGGGSTPLVGSLTSTSTTSALRADQGPAITALISTAQNTANSAGTAAANAQASANTANSRIDSLVVGSGLPTLIAPTTVIPLDGIKEFNADVYVTATPFTVGTFVDGATCTFTIRGDGVLSPTFSSDFHRHASSADFDTTFNALNNVTCWIHRGRAYYAIWYANPIEIYVPPTTVLNNIFTASGLTQAAGGSYTITLAGLKGSSSVSAVGDYTLIADFTGNTSATIAFGVATSNTAGSWTGGFQFAILDDVGGPRWAYVENGTQTNPFGISWDTTSANRRARIKRTGTVETLDISNDAGATWTTIRTSADAGGVRYPVIGSYTAGGTLKLSGQGFA